MDLANLQTFITIAEQQSFSLAGERLHVTQPAISKRLASLEEQLGVRLFDRIGRTIRLTEAGQALLPRAYRIVNELEDARSEEHTSELQSRPHLVCRLLLEKKKIECMWYV